MKRIVLYLISLRLLLLASCAHHGPEFDEPPHATHSIAYLKSLCRSASTVVTADISITGHVVANDIYGEYHKAIVIGDNSGCIEVALECDHTSEMFPNSAMVSIHCTGLHLGRSSGKVILGAKPTSQYTIDRIPYSRIWQHITVNCEKLLKIAPLSLSISELQPHHIGNNVALNEVTFAHQAGLTWCDNDEQTGKHLTTIRHIQDKAGNSLQVRTIGQCLYCDENIPYGWGTLWGIIEQVNDNYSLRIINHSIKFQQQKK